MLAIVAVIAVAVAAGSAYYVLNNAASKVTQPLPRTTSSAGHVTSATHASSTSSVSATASTTVRTVEGEKVIGVTDLTNPQKLLSTFKAMKVTLYMNKPNMSSNVTFSYSVSEGGVVGNASTYKVRISVSSGKRNASAFLWVTKDFSNIVKVEMPGGQVLSGRNAAIYGRMLLMKLNQYMLASGDMGRLKIYVFPNGTLKSTLPGWRIVSVKKAQLSIDGKTYSGYKVMFVEAGTGNSTSSSPNSTLEVGIAKIRSNLWYFSYIKLSMSEGTALIRVEHIELGG